MLKPEHWPDWTLRGTSTAAERLRLQVDRVAPHFRTALVVAERGCMKSEVARALHARSPLRQDPFILCRNPQMPCEALEQPGRATLYLTNAGELNLEQQAHLLRWFRSSAPGRRTEMRLILGSEVSGRGLVAGGRLLPDLASLIAAVEIRVVPLRQRLEDVRALLDGLALSPDALDRMQQHRWPGNLRELHGVVAEAVARAGGNPVTADHLPTLEDAAAPPKQDLRLDAVLHRHVVSVLETCAGNKLRAAELLGISRSTLYRMLEAGSGTSDVAAAEG